MGKDKTKQIDQSKGAPLENPTYLVDGDILAYKAASATDGRIYSIRYELDCQAAFIREKYKKEADAVVKDLEDKGIVGIKVNCEYEPEDLSVATKILEDSLSNIKELLKPYTKGTPTVGIFLSRHGSFREKEYSGYKSNRLNMRRPANLEGCKDYLILKHHAICKEGKLEADDLMAMRQTSNSIICSIDKDLLQVPGYHFNFDKNIFQSVSREEGLRNFYQQVLTGDSTDGIPGLKGVGPVGAKKILKDLKDPYEMYIAVLRKYIEVTERLPEEQDEEFYLRVFSTLRTNARLLYLLRSEGDSWEAPERTIG